MATMTRNQIAKQLVPGLNKILGESYGKIDGEDKPLFDSEKSNRSFEEELMMTGLGAAPVKAEGAAVMYDDAQETWVARYQHETVALAYAITEEAMEDNLYVKSASRYSKYLGRAMATTRQIKAASVYNNAFNNSYAGGDGVALVSASHPVIQGGTQSNYTNTDMSETALENAIVAIEAFQDDRGILIGAMAESLHIPSGLRWTTHKILKSDLSTTTATFGTDGITNVNDKNVLGSGGYFPKGVSINRRFTDPDAWFIRTNTPEGMKNFDRVGLQMGKEGDFDTGNGKFKARERYSYGWSDWRDRKSVV